MSLSVCSFPRNDVGVLSNSEVQDCSNQSQLNRISEISNSLFPASFLNSTPEDRNSNGSENTKFSSELFFPIPALPQISHCQNFSGPIFNGNKRKIAFQEQDNPVKKIKTSTETHEISTAAWETEIEECGSNMFVQSDRDDILLNHSSLDFDEEGLEASLLMPKNASLSQIVSAFENSQNLQFSSQKDSLELLEGPDHLNTFLKGPTPLSPPSTTVNKHQEFLRLLKTATSPSRKASNLKKPTFPLIHPSSLISHRRRIKQNKPVIKKIIHVDGQKIEFSSTDFANKIRHIRGEMSRESFADLCGLSLFQIGRYETELSFPPASALRRIADRTGMPIEYFSLNPQKAVSVQEEPQPPENLTAKPVSENKSRSYEIGNEKIVLSPRDFSEKIKKLRGNRSHKEFAKLFEENIKSSSLKTYEGRRYLPKNSKTLEIIAKATKMPIKHFSCKTS
ncbi:MAG: helix-turn-helix transcriptional regulator [Chlamydiota bacterium]